MQAGTSYYHSSSIMSELQRLWARSKVGPSNDTLAEVDGGSENDALGELPEHVDDDSSSASSVSSTGTIIPSPNQNLFARTQGYARVAFPTIARVC